MATGSARTTLPALGAVVDGRFQLEGVLGSGSEAIVYRAADNRGGRPVALKVFRKPWNEGGERREVLIQRRIRHSGIVALQDYADHTGAGDAPDYAVLELVEGATLKNILSSGPAEPRLVAAWAESLLMSLAHIHSRGIVHHDIKPSNILIPHGPKGRIATHAKLTDFGIASSRALPCTSSGYGTAHYMSPEQAAGGTAGAAGDIYALGLVLLESLAGARPFPGGAIQSMLARTLRRPHIPADLGRRWAALIGAMTAVDPSERVTARQALRLLRRVQHADFRSHRPDRVRQAEQDMRRHKLAPSGLAVTENFAA
ncbi:serine/threonine protein kinase [Arthrobacter sp. I2-34]|uniref:Serine/threonine protein kinase n=1 Tax=Arthrobacter hankyongi TaxID=2904801 RepID=A0ABS9LB19_9MICC|nr:serine/threonine-protein kinase [Arthrobacter hankyongi]MCG2623662.1 serine/threonine protein kinase [Arthrobacter hankyongi]